MTCKYKGFEIMKTWKHGYTYYIVTGTTEKPFYREYDGVGGYKYHERTLYSRQKDAKMAIDEYLEKN